MKLLVVATVLFIMAFAAPIDDPGEFGDKYGGDMLLSPVQQHAAFRRSGLGDTTYRWPHGVLPICDSATMTQTQWDIFETAINIFAPTCIKFRPCKQTDYDYVEVKTDQPGCFSYLGRLGGNQTLNLGSDCWRAGVIVHELMHALGVAHMHQTPDRDSYVDIVWNNVINETEKNFEILRNVYAFGAPYDYNSIMHYPRTAFSRNGEDTIVPKKSGANIGQRNGLSVHDIERINTMYNCPNN